MRPFYLDFESAQVPGSEVGKGDLLVDHRMVTKVRKAKPGEWNEDKFSLSFECGKYFTQAGNPAALVIVGRRQPPAPDSGLASSLPAVLLDAATALDVARVCLVNASWNWG